MYKRHIIIYKDEQGVEHQSASFTSKREAKQTAKLWLSSGRIKSYQLCGCDGDNYGTMYDFLFWFFLVGIVIVAAYLIWGN